MNSITLPFEAERPLDLICMGRVAVDLYAEQIGVSLSQASSFKKSLGGCAGNIAVGSARLGLKTLMFSCVGADEMGEFLLQTLKAEGVATDLVYQTAEHLTALVLLGINPPDNFPLIFYRENCADMQIRPEHIKADYFNQAKALLITGTGLSKPDILAATQAAIAQAAQSRTAIILDLDFRPVLWGLTAKGNGENRYVSNPEVSETYQSILPHCQLLVGTEEEFCIAAGKTDIKEALGALKAMTQASLVLKTGARGCRIYPAGGKEIVAEQTFPVDILNVLGAGDAFLSGLLTGLLSGKSWEEAARLGNAAGAIVVSRHGCSSASPSRAELNYFINHYALVPTIWRSAKLKQIHQATTPLQGQSNPLKAAKPFAAGLNPIVNDQGTGLYFYSLKLAAKEEYNFTTDMETAALLLSGRVCFHYENQSQPAERFDFFEQAPTVLHCSINTPARVEALADSELLIIATRNEKTFPAQLFTADNLLELDERGQGLLENTAYRQVRTVFDKRNRPESNLVVGEIISMQGRWSSYPSHDHPQPEIYHYRFSEPQGFAFGEQGDKVVRIEHRDTYLIKGGDSHAHCVAPGYALYTLWFIRHLPGAPYSQPRFAPEHEWTRQPAANRRAWMKESV